MRKGIAVLLTILVTVVPFGTPYLLWQKKVNDMLEWPIIWALLDSDGETTTETREYDVIDERYKEASSITSGISYNYMVNGVTYHGSQNWSGHYDGPDEGFGVYIKIRYNPKNPAESVYDVTKIEAPVWIYFVSIFIVPNLIVMIWLGWAKRKSIRSLYFPKAGKS